MTTILIIPVAGMELWMDCENYCNWTIAVVQTTQIMKHQEAYYLYGYQDIMQMAIISHPRTSI